MNVSAVTPQLRTTDLEASIDFYVNKIGFELAFRYEDFYAGIQAGAHVFHLKLVDSPDPSIGFVRDGEHVHLIFTVDDVEAKAAELAKRIVALHKAPENTAWGTRDFYVLDNQGHTLCFSQPL